MASSDAPLPGLLGIRRAKSAPSPVGAETVPADAENARYRLHRRFDRMGRLVGDPGMARLFQSHVMVVGLGGVGSWAAEALVRAGVGKVSLVDFDLVCITNGNRQLHAMKGTTGRPKVDVMADRLRLVNPAATVEPVREFYSEANSASLLGRAPDLVVDAIDNLTAKAHLIAECTRREIALVVSGGASGRLDPTQIREADLAQVKGDNFIAALRKILRRDHGFAGGKSCPPYGIPTVHSLEPTADPLPLAYDGGEGFRCVCPQGDNGLHTCDHRSVIYGTAGFVTGAFGLACAAASVRRLVGGETNPSA